MPSTLLIFAVRDAITFTFQSRIYGLLPFSFYLTLPFDFFFFWYWFVWVIYITWVLFIPLSDIYFCNYFLPFCNVTFSFCWSLLWLCRSFPFDVAPLINFCLFLVLLVSSKKKKSLPRPMSGSFSPVFSSRNFTVLSLMFKSLIYFELIFAWLYDLKPTPFLPIC